MILYTKLQFTTYHISSGKPLCHQRTRSQALLGPDSFTARTSCGFSRGFPR